MTASTFSDDPLGGFLCCPGPPGADPGPGQHQLRNEFCLKDSGDASALRFGGPSGKSGKVGGWMCATVSIKSCFSSTPFHKVSIHKAPKQILHILLVHPLLCP